MKRILALSMAILMALSLVGCGKKDRIMYNSVNLKKYVDLIDYKGLEVDTSSKDFKETYESIIETDIEDYNLYVKKTEGKVEEGDVANIDFVGKKDGVAFEGGTSNGYDLEIGSGNFIDGFEDGLIGVEIGETVDLDLKFPENYGNEELNGAAVVFTVTVNYVIPKDKTPLEPKDYFKDLGFDSLEDYENDVKDQAVETILAEIILNKSEIKDYPKKDSDFLLEEMTNYFISQLSDQYNMTLGDYLTQTGSTKEELDNSTLEEQVYPLMDQLMPMYAIIDAEEVEVTSKDIKEKIDRIIKQNDGNVTEKELKELYGEYYFEGMAVNEKAIKIIKDNAKIK